MVRTAREIYRDIKGLPYEHGGRYPAGKTIDCLGLILYIAKELGYELPDWTYEEGWASKGHNFFLGYYKIYCDIVSVDDLRDGDIIFFRMSKVITNHVGMYIGNGQFVQCEQQAGCCVGRVDDPRYRRRITVCCRLKKKLTEGLPQDGKISLHS